MTWGKRAVVLIGRLASGNLNRKREYGIEFGEKWTDLRDSGGGINSLLFFYGEGDEREHSRMIPRFLL